MDKLVGAAVAVAFASIVAAVPSQAEMLGGAPIRNGNQCWTNSPGNGNQGFGYWEQCQTRAATPARTTLLRHPLRARRDQHNDR